MTGQPQPPTWHTFVDEGMGSIVRATCTGVIFIHKDQVYTDVSNPDTPGKPAYIISAIERPLSECCFVLMDDKYSWYGSYTKELIPKFGRLNLEDKKIFTAACRKFRRAFRRGKLPDISI